MPYGYGYQPFYGGNQMNQMINPSAQPMMQQAQPGSLFARYVASREEAVAAQVLPDGNLNVFIDANNGRIYTKAVAGNGMSDFREYAFVQPQPKMPEGQGVTIEMFNQLRGEVEGLKAARRPMEVVNE